MSIKMASVGEYTTLSVFLFIIVVLFIFVVIFSWYGHRQMFRPTAFVDETGKSFGTKFKEFNIKGINGRHYVNPGSKHTILFCHGNNGSIGVRGYIISLCEIYNIDLILFDYHGFGKSIGTPYQYSLQKDAELIYQYYLDTKKSTDDLIIWGESLGGSPAIHLASKYDCGLLMLFCTFSSAKETLHDYEGIMWTAGSILFPYIFDPMDSKTKLRKVKATVILVHSDQDEMIPFPNALRNLENITHDNKILIKIKGIHEDPIMDEEIMNQMMMYLSTGDITKVPVLNVEPKGIIFDINNVDSMRKYRMSVANEANVEPLVTVISESEQVMKPETEVSVTVEPKCIETGVTTEPK